MGLHKKRKLRGANYSKLFELKVSWNVKIDYNCSDILISNRVGQTLAARSENRSIFE